MKKISYIDDTEIKNKRVILRANFDVSLNPNATIAEDLRIKENLPTINYLLKQNNRIICIAKLGRPVSLDPKLSLKIIIPRLREYLSRALRHPVLSRVALWYESRLPPT